jgi:ATP-binding cassette subfamily B (MDR/TAP) protein 1
MADVSQIALRFLYVAIGATVAGYLQQACWSYTSVRQANRMRRMFLEAVLRQEIAFFDTEATTGEHHCQPGSRKSMV